MAPGVVRKPPKQNWAAIIVVVAFAGLVGIVGGGMDAARKGVPSTPQTTPSAGPAAEDDATASAPPANFATLDEAISGLRSGMSDAVNEVSPGAGLLAMWSAEHMDWNELQAVPATKVSLVMKDSAEQRGKRICASGQIFEIAAEKALSETLYSGGMFDSYGNIYRFIAVKSTGDLVRQSWATFCGVVIGRQDYSNSGGGVSHAVFLVGMFKLTENLPPKNRSKMR